MTKDWRPHARHIVEAIDRILRYQAMPLEDETLRDDAILRNLHTLSESADRLPDELKRMHPDIPWRDVKGFRNHLVHEYLGNGIDRAIVKAVIDRQLPILRSAVARMLADG